jgi:hypothetical protein
MGLGSAPAGANLDNDEVGAALAMPFFATDTSLTYMTVTNVSDQPQTLEIRLIDGSASGSWDVDSLSCSMTPSETVLFLVQGIEVGTEFLSLGGLQCTGNFDIDAGVVGAKRAVIPGDQGIVFFSLSGPGNALFGDWVILDKDLEAGFGAGAIAFQAGPVANEDDVFVFDGTEYTQFPSSLAANFLYPGGVVDEGFFVLFTLNGRSGRRPTVEVKVDFYDQFEQSRDANFTFRCFDTVPFDSISLNWTAENNPGSLAGHVVMAPRDGSPFHGWIVQSDRAGLWARTLVSSAGNFPRAVFDDD